MRVHHLNCATMCPPVVGKMVCHVLAVESADGIILVDTGLGTADLANPIQRLGRGFIRLTRPRFDRSETALLQLQALGFAARDVRHIVVTHLDLDHAGGLSDFPDALVHVSAAEHEAATAPSTAGERDRYRRLLWGHGPKWKTYAAGGEMWHGFAGVRAMEDLPPEILLVPLPGHTRGHHGIAVRRDNDAGWMLHAGDAYFFRGEMDAQPRCPLLLRALQRLNGFDAAARIANQKRLRALARDAAANVHIFCAHDVRELERCRASSR